MGIIDEANKLHINIKTIAFGFVFIMPVWFIDIFLFAKPFFNHNPIYIPIIFAFWLSSLWLIACIIYSILFNLTEPEHPSGETGEVTKVLVTSIASGYILLSMNTLTAYQCKFSLMQALYMNFLLIVGLIFFAFIRWRMHDRKKATNKIIKESEPTESI